MSHYSVPGKRIAIGNALALAAKTAWRNRDALRSAWNKWRSSRSGRGQSTALARRPRRRMNISSLGGSVGKIRIGGQLGNDSGISHFRRLFRTKKKFLRGYKKVLAPQILNSVVSTRLFNSAANTQAVFVPLAYSGAAGSVGLLNQYLISTTDMGDCMSILGIPETVVGNTARTRRMLLESVKARYRFKNQTNVPVTLTLYDVVARRDFFTTALDPISAWTTGLTDQQVSLIGVPNSNAQTDLFPGSTPFQSQKFCQMYKVRKTKKFVLHAGSEHDHYVHLNAGGILNNEYITNWVQYRGLTYCLMVVVEGAVVDDAVGAASNVGISGAGVDCVCETRYKFTAVERARTMFTQYNALPTLGAQNTVLEDTDAVTAVATA